MESTTQPAATSPGSANFAAAVDAVRSVLRGEDELMPAPQSPDEAGALVAGLVDLAVSLAGHVVGVDAGDIDRLLVQIRDASDAVDLIPIGGS